VTKINKIIWLLVLFAIGFAGCGYRFPGSGAFPEGVNRVFVEVLKNKTNESGIENLVTRSLIDEFILREKDSIASDIEDADSVLRGAVTKINIHTITAAGRDSAAERRVTVSINLKLSSKDGKVIWVANGLSDNQAYSVLDDKNLSERNKREAIGLASRRIAERALNRLTDDF
jgi:hypothetical protein